jgi:RimJ/RimL family protein N-acetyltransferase
MTIESAGRWVRRLAEHPFAWVIAREELIGEIRLDRVDPTDRRASLAVGIVDPRALGKGYGTEAIRLVLGYAFRDLSLHRVSARVLAYNARAIRSYEKCGFVFEGREREAAHVDGEWHDDVIMAVLDREFLGG